MTVHDRVATLVDDVSSVLTSPESHFSEHGTETLRSAVVFGICMFGVTGTILNTWNRVIGQAFGTVAPQEYISPFALPLNLTADFVIFGILGTAFFVITTAIIHACIWIAGGRGFRTTMTILGYSAATVPLTIGLLLIPSIGAILSLASLVYGIYIASVGTSIQHNMRFRRAVIATGLPAVLLVALLVGTLLFFSIFTIQP